MLACLCGVISLILLIVAIASTAWLHSDGYRQGLWEECFISENNTMSCGKNAYDGNYELLIMPFVDIQLITRGQLYLLIDLNLNIFVCNYILFYLEQAEVSTLWFNIHRDNVFTYYKLHVFCRSFALYFCHFSVSIYLNKTHISKCRCPFVYVKAAIYS